MNILEAHNLTKTCLVEDQNIHILDDISFSIVKGDFVVIEGRSGSGKTTLLAILSGLDHPSSGTILIDQVDITHMSEDQLAPLRNQTFGFVFQSFHLIPSLTALENIMLPAELLGDKQARSKAFNLMQEVGIEKRQSGFPHQLSGGEKQRVAICRALINQPQIIFADEPTGNLDSENSDAILNLLLTLRKNHGSTLIMVTHSQEISKMAERVITLKDGKIISNI